MHMEKTFGNKRDHDAMIRALYEVQQEEDETGGVHAPHTQRGHGDMSRVPRVHS